MEVHLKISRFYGASDSRNLISLKQHMAQKFEKETIVYKKRAGGFQEFYQDVKVLWIKEWKRGT